MPKNSLRVNLSPSAFEALAELADWTKTGPETLAARLLNGVLNAIGASRALEEQEPPAGDGEGSLFQPLGLALHSQRAAGEAPLE
jgi:hypothetical protein